MIFGVRWYWVIALVAFAVLWLAFAAKHIGNALWPTVSDALAINMNPLEYVFREALAVMVAIGPALVSLVAVVYLWERSR